MMPLSETGRMLTIYAAAAFFEIAGCFALWAVLRLGKPAWWTLPGVVSLLVFAGLLTRIDVDLAGRAYAAYGGIYIVASLVWLWGVENQTPDRWDLAGAGLCLMGTLVILAGRHGATP
ncbi:YnfA family protein [Marinobacter sp. C2H3]|uniref:YnfA family protein n=1 Tax=Marinobacter sp. C2H3 TaxID=3119003 RepID=UPI00300EC861